MGAEQAPEPEPSHTGSSCAQGARAPSGFQSPPPARRGGPSSPTSRKGKKHRFLGALKPPRTSKRAIPELTKDKAALAKQCLRDLERGVVIISVPDSGLGDSFGVQLAEALCPSSGQPCQVKMLELERNQLGEPTAAGLGRALASASSRLQVIELGSNALGDSGSRALADGLKASGSLQQLDVHDNGIGPLGADYLSAALVGNQHVKALHLGGNRIGPNGVRILVESLEQNFALRTLSLFDCGLGDLGAQYVARSLSRASRLRELSIGSNAIRDHGAAALSEMLKVNRVLRELQLERNEVGDAGGIMIAESLAVNHGLQQLWLPENPITEVAILKFAEYLEKNTGIQNLGLSFNGGPDSACVEALRRAKRKRLERRRAAMRSARADQPSHATKMSTRSAAADGDQSARVSARSGFSARSAFNVALVSARDSPAGARAGAGDDADAFLDLDQMPTSVSEAVIGEIQELEADLNDRLLVWELPMPSARTPRTPTAREDEGSDSSDGRVNEELPTVFAESDEEGACAGVFAESDEEGN